MPKPNGPQFKDVNEARKFVESLKLTDIEHLAPKTPQFLNEQTTRALMKTVNIRQWPLQNPVGDIRETTSHDGTTTIYPHETLHTSQRHLHLPTLQKYLKGDIPEYDEMYAPDEVPYNPEVLYDPHGNMWIDEGHHRIVTSRLNEHSYQDAYAGNIWEKK